MKSGKHFLFYEKSTAFVKHIGGCKTFLQFYTGKTQSFQHVNLAYFLLILADFLLI